MTDEINKKETLKILDKCLEQLHEMADEEVRDIHKKVNRKILKERRENNEKYR